MMWSETVPTRRWGSAGSWAIAGFGCLFWTAIGGSISKDVRPKGRLAKGFLIFAAMGLFVWEPIAVLALLGLFGWGRIKD